MRDPDKLRRRAGIRGDVRQDQHFLIDDRVLNRLPSYAESFDLSSVLEIGAGTGALTDRLLNASDKVTVIERDSRLVHFLRDEFKSAISQGRLRIIGGDVLSVDLPVYSVSISNLPYGISSEVLFRLLPRKQPAIVMVQREFAERLVAAPGESSYGRSSVTAQHYGELEIVEVVPPTAFDPQPAVDSAIVRFTPRSASYDVVDEEGFMDFVTGVFTQRRKTIRNAIRNTTHITGIENPEGLIDRVDEELLRKRAGELSPEDFAGLSRKANELEEDT